MSSIVTFYSYKGGVGRTMAMANVAVLLAQRDLKVLTVDWDLEAPGLERYFGYFTVTPAKGGLLRLLRDQHRGSRGHYRRHLTRVSGTVANRAFELDVLPSGRETDVGYSVMLEQFDWEDYFADGGGDFIEDLRSRWRRDYDVVLVDSRTGLSDTGGICTIQLPDVVVAMFTANYQSLYGVRDTMRLAQAARNRLAYDRMHLRVLPVPTRFSAGADSPEPREWVDRIADVLGEFYQDWLAKGVVPRQVTEALRIPQIDAFGFGEKLALVEEESLSERPMTSTYQKLADLLAAEIPNTAAILGLQPATTPASAPRSKGPGGYEYDLFVGRATSSVLNEWLDAFISRLSTLVSAQLGRDLRVFQDLSEVRVDDVWKNAVEKALVRSRVLLAIVTPEFLSSQWCLLEWATFERREKEKAARELIVPVMLQRPDPLPDWMSRRQVIDISDLPRRVSAFAESSPEVVGRLAELARLVTRRVRSAPAFDAGWTSAADRPSALAAPPSPPSESGTSELTLDADALTALLKTEGRTDALDAARKLIPTLRRDRDFVALLKVAGAIHEHDPDDHRTALHYARALVETGDLTAAQKLLAPLVRQPRRKSEFSEAIGLLGRAYKEQFMASRSKRTTAARKALSHAVAAYRAGYERDRHRNVFHGVNLVALLAAARRHRLKTGTSLREKPIARQIVADLEKRPESLRGPWDHAAAAELHLALGDWNAFGRSLQAYMADSRFEASGLNGFLRQLTELWELESDPVHGAPHIAALRARVLSTPGGAVDLRPATGRAADPVAPASAPLQAFFDDRGQRSVEWLRTGLTRAQSVGVVVDRANRRLATCFLVRARDFGVESGECVVITTAHVVSSRAGAAIKPKDAAVVFEALHVKGRFDVAEELWSSPGNELDAAILRLHRPPTDVDGLPLASHLPSRDEPHRVYLIGHPGGRQLSFSLQDNELLDHEGPPDGTPSTAGIVRLHYRGATEAGSSGSPVFDDEWRVIALHHLAGPSIARLNGQAGTYAASEGIWIQSIVAAFRK
jgi:MinD-like ATPase involved in chromosome partitioning or flagellar assembly